MMYRLASPWPGSVEQVEAALEDARFVECGASQEKSVGWIEPRGHANGRIAIGRELRGIGPNHVNAIDLGHGGSW